MYSRVEFIKDLKEELNKEFNIKRLSRWALIIHMDKKYFDPEIDNIIFRIIAMEEGEEFVLSKNQLLSLVRDLENK